MEAGEKLSVEHCKKCESTDCNHCCEKCITLNLSSLDLQHVPNVSNFWGGIEKLYMDYNELDAIPGEIFDHLVKLKVLSFIGNNVCELPENIGSASALVELYCNENELRMLPKCFTALRELKLLNIVGNKVNELPSNFEDLHRLEKLFADENLLIALPDAFGLLSHLEILELESNKIKVLPRSFGCLNALKILNLSSNKLCDLPKNFGEMRSLQIVDISSNFVRDLPETMKSCDTLKKLYCDNNDIAELPDWIGHLPVLEEIGFKNNQLKNEAIPESFGKISTKLKFLHFGGNYITFLPNTIGHLVHLETLHFGSVISELERRNFQNGNWLSHIPEAFGNMISLRSVNLEENQLQELPESFGQLVNLETLDVGQNQLHELPLSFGKLKSLRVCQLSKNHIEILPSNFGDLSNLEELRMDHNQIAELPESFGRLSKLKSLDLFNNCLSEFPESLTSLVNLVRLDLDRNNLDLHYLKVPQLIVASKYAPRDPNLKDNWRGKTRQDQIRVPVTKVEAVENGEESTEEEEEEVQYNESFLRHAMEHNMSMWRSHNGSGVREVSLRYGNSMVMMRGSGARPGLSNGYLENSFSTEEDEVTSESSEDYKMSRLSSSSSSSVPQQASENFVQTTENWDEEFDNSIPVDVNNPYDTKPTVIQEDMYEPGVIEYRFVGTDHIFLPSVLHAPRVQRRPPQLYTHASQFENPDGTRVLDERTKKNLDNKRQSQYHGDFGELVEGQFDDEEDEGMLEENVTDES